MNNLVRPNESPKQQGSSPSERQGKTWHSLTEIYGARWIRENGDAPGRVWGSMINALTDNQIATALAHLVKTPRKDGRGNIHPPSAPEFWEAAKAGMPRPQPSLSDNSHDFSHYGKGANFRLLRLILREGGLDDAHVKPMVKEKNRIVNDYDMMAADGLDIDWDEFVTTIDKNLDRVLKDLRA